MFSIKFRKNIKYLGKSLKQSSRKRVSQQYMKRMGYPLNLKSPACFNEKLQWLKLYWRDPNLVQLADKFEVRRFVSDRVGSHYLVPLIAVCNSAEEVTEKAVGKRVAIKMVHGSGWNILVTDPGVVDWNEVEGKCREWLASNYYFSSREFQYKNISPRVVVEELLSDEAGSIPKDYKFHVFNSKGGIHMFVQVDSDRFEHHTRNFYSADWEPISMSLQYETGVIEHDAPKNFNEMKRVALALSRDFPYVRIDLYDTGDKVYFGEITFTPGSGYEKFSPETYDRSWGDLIDLNSYKHLLKRAPV